MHGGRTPRGLALNRPAGLETTGLGSRDLPTRMAAAVELRLTDPTLLDLRDKMAAMDHIWQQVARRVEDDGNDGPRAWERARAALDAFRAASALSDPEAAARAAGAALAELDGIISGRIQTYAALASWLDITDRYRRLVDTQRRRDEALRLSIPIERVMLMIHTIQDAINEVLGELPITPEMIARAKRRVADRIDVMVHGRGSDR